MALTTNQRQSIIADLTTNCDCWKHPGDAQLLNDFTDEKLLQLKETAGKEKLAVDVANAAVRGFTDGDIAYRLNPETGKWERGTTANAGKLPPVPGPPDALDLEPPPKPKVRTQEQIVNSLPVELQEKLRVADEVMQREKNSLIGQILTNSGVAEADKRAHAEWLQARGVDDLRNMLTLLPKQPSREEAERVANKQPSRIHPPIDNDMLGLPTSNWHEVEDQDDQPDKQSSGLPDSEEDWDSFIRNAPPRFRSMINNATAIEAREKRRLIEQLTANVTDEEAEKKLVSTLNTKTLDELQSLLALAPPKKETVRPNYFGAGSAPPSPVVSNRGSVDEDVLPLPAWGN